MDIFFLRQQFSFYSKVGKYKWGNVGTNNKCAELSEEIWCENNWHPVLKRWFTLWASFHGKWLKPPSMALDYKVLLMCRFPLGADSAQSKLCPALVLLWSKKRSVSTHRPSFLSVRILSRLAPLQANNRLASPSTQPLFTGYLSGRHNGR